MIRASAASEDNRDGTGPSGLPNAVDSRQARNRIDLGATMRRPASVTVIAVLLILGSVIGVASPLLAALHPEINAEAAQRVAQISRLPAGVLKAISFVVAAINLVSAILLLRGRVLGRMIYTIVGALMLVELVVTTRVLLAPLMVLPLVEYAVFVFLLFRPAASAWLRQGHV